MKIILPEDGPVLISHDGIVRVVPWIYAQSEKKIIYVAIPNTMIPSFGKIEEVIVPRIAVNRKAVYVRTSEPNCHGIAHYELRSIE